MLAARLVTLGQLAPRAHRMMASAATLRFALAATHRVIDRVYHHAADGGPDALATAAPGFAARDGHVIDVPDLDNRGITGDVNLANFARRHAHQGVIAFAVAEHAELPGAAGDL